MKKTDVVTALNAVDVANDEWLKARVRFNSDVDAIMARLIHEAAKNFMSAEAIAVASGWSVKRVKERMRALSLDPRDGIALLSRKAAEALATNSALMGIEPSEMDLMSPLAYLPMGSEMRRDLAANSVSQVHEVSGNEVTPEMVEAFRAAWHLADAAGDSGHRVEAGLTAALRVMPA